MADNPQAFPTSAANPGMSLRDWFAGQALAGLCAMDAGGVILVANMAYSIADAMLAERERTPTT